MTLLRIVPVLAISLALVAPAFAEGVGESESTSFTKADGTKYRINCQDGRCSVREKKKGGKWTTIKRVKQTSSGTFLGLVKSYEK